MKKHSEMTKEELQREMDALMSVPLSDADQHLIQNLLVHQVELEMQNRTLAETQGRLEESRDRYADLYDHSPVGYVTIDEKAVIKEINLTATTMIDVERTIAIGKTFTAFMENHDARQFIQYMSEASQSAQSISIDLPLRVKGRDPLPVQMLLVREWSISGNSNLLRICIIDQSQRKRREQE
ncbi:MAG: PAS domain-containing protein [Ignavibacteriae bacterium]|nr:PAS domain-containing protein [Ignavibacteriota bacterium]